MATRIMVGDCREILPQFPNDYFHCVVTSPPFWGLRDYGIPPSVWGGDPDCRHEWETVINKRGGGGEREYGSHDGGVGRGPAPKLPESAFCQRCGAWRGCLGLEPTPELYVSHLVDIFREVKRVLRDDGTAWVNLGDCYNSGTNTKRQPGYGKHGYWTNPMIDQRVFVPNLKRKDLVGMPWRVAFALQADGWWLRSAIVWQKPNCMPESVTDRPTNDYEFMFLLAKSARYFYDNNAIREESSPSSLARAKYNNGDSSPKNIRGVEDGIFCGPMSTKKAYGQGRNRRAVWTIPTYPYSEAHFATFPPALVEPCIKAGTSERGACLECGAGWVRVVEKGKLVAGEGAGRLGDRYEGTLEDVIEERYRGANFRKTGYAPGHHYENNTIGWQPTCTCYGTKPLPKYPKQGEDESDEAYSKRIAPIRAERLHLLKEWEPLPTRACRVLDPFSGAGTTGMVADRLGRDAVLIDIKAEYCEIARERIVEDAGPMFAQVMMEASLT